MFDTFQDIAPLLRELLQSLFSQHFPQMPLIQVSVNDDEDIEGVYKRFRNSCNLAGMVYEVRTVYSIPSSWICPLSLAEKIFPPCNTCTAFTMDLLICYPLRLAPLKIAGQEKTAL